jgi:hypothetical protein
MSWSRVYLGACNCYCVVVLLLFFLFAGCLVPYITAIVFVKFQAKKPDSYLGSASLEKQAEKLIVRHMNRAEVAAVFCDCICGGCVPAHLERFIDVHAKWTLVSGIIPDGAAAPSDSMQDFHGIAGLRAISHFCREHLKVLSSDMSGWVVHENCSFALGRLRLQYHPEKESAETRFVAKLLWTGLQIFLGEIRIMWPFDPGEYRKMTPESSVMATEVIAAPNEAITGVSRFAM